MDIDLDKVGAAKRAYTDEITALAYAYAVRSYLCDEALAELAPAEDWLHETVGDHEWVTCPRKAVAVAYLSDCVGPEEYGRVAWHTPATQAYACMVSDVRDAVEFVALTTDSIDRAWGERDEDAIRAWVEAAS